MNFEMTPSNDEFAVFFDLKPDSSHGVKNHPLF